MAEPVNDLQQHHEELLQRIGDEMEQLWVAAVQRPGEPILKFRIANRRAAPVDLGAFPRELRDRIYHYTFRNNVSFSDEPKFGFDSTVQDLRSETESYVRLPFITYENDEIQFDVVGQNTIYLYDVAEELRPEIEEYILSDCKFFVGLSNFSRRAPQGFGFLRHARKLVLAVSMEADDFASLVIPFLTKRNDLKSLELIFTHWPYSGVEDPEDLAHACMEIMEMLSPLAELKVKHVSIWSTEDTEAERKVLDVLEAVMMGKRAALPVLETAEDFLALDGDGEDWESTDAETSEEEGDNEEEDDEDGEVEEEDWGSEGPEEDILDDEEWSEEEEGENEIFYH